MVEPLIRNVSDTARWAAMFRANETDRPDALFRDPLARRLAGERGAEIFNKMPLVMGRDTSWSWVARTVLFDREILQAIGEGFDTVLNLACGMDARPYRLDLPAKLRWIEADLPPILKEKEEILRGEKPACQFERVAIDLADAAARRKFFDRVQASAQRVLVLTEGLVIYLGAAGAEGLARDLASETTFRRWILDLVSPGLLQMMLKHWEKILTDAKAPVNFAPAEGTKFFERAGWRAVRINSVLKEASREKRLKFPLSFFAKLPDAKDGKAGKRPWSAVCVMERA